MKKRILLYFCLTLLSSNLLFSQSILSATRYWDGGDPSDDGQWMTVLNWDNNMLPEFDADVVINNDESVNFATPNDVTVESISLGNDNSVNGMTLIPHSGDLTIESGSNLNYNKRRPRW